MSSPANASGGGIGGRIAEQKNVNCEYMKPTGIKVTPEELEQVKVAQSCSGMFLSGGMPMGNPQELVFDLCKKYNPPEGSGLNLKTGEFCLP